MLGLRQTLLEINEAGLQGLEPRRVGCLDVADRCLIGNGLIAQETIPGCVSVCGGEPAPSSNFERKTVGASMLFCHGPG